MNFIKRWKQKRAYKINAKKLLKLQQDLQRGIQILINMDEGMKKDGRPRKYRRRFWYDFYRNHKVRAEIFQKLLKQYNVNVEALQQQIKPKKVLKAKKPAIPNSALAAMDRLEKEAVYSGRKPGMSMQK